MALWWPAKPSMATTLTRLGMFSSRLASQLLRASAERPATMSRSRAGLVPSMTDVRSTMTVTKSGSPCPRRCFHLRSSIPR